MYFIGFTSPYTPIKYVLKLQSTLSGCRGGEVCDQQPMLEIQNEIGGTVTTFNGSVYATLSSSPTGKESLYVARCQHSDCIEKVEGLSPSTTFIAGIATIEVA